MIVCKRCTGGFEADEGMRSQSAEMALNPRYGKFRWANPPI